MENSVFTGILILIGFSVAAFAIGITIGILLGRSTNRRKPVDPPKPGLKVAVGMRFVPPMSDAEIAERDRLFPAHHTAAPKRVKTPQPPPRIETAEEKETRLAAEAAEYVREAPSLLSAADTMAALPQLTAWYAGKFIEPWRQLCRANRKELAIQIEAKHPGLIERIMRAQPTIRL